MPRKYKAEKDDYFFFASVASVFGMLRPIEEQLKKGGYIGNVLADYDETICQDLGIEHQSPLYYMAMIDNAERLNAGTFTVESDFKMKQFLTKGSEKEFRNYVKKYSDYLELLIRQTRMHF